MKIEQKLKELSTAELNKKFKKLKLSAVIVIIIMLALVLFSVFTTKEQETSYLYVFPSIFMPIFLINFIWLRKVKTEIESRNQS